MRKAEILGVVNPPQKPIEFTHILTAAGCCKWNHEDLIRLASKVVYLGNCSSDGDMFVIFTPLNRGGQTIHIAKGHLNDGTY